MKSGGSDERGYENEQGYRNKNLENMDGGIWMGGL
jgi:hypothetical protein